MESRSGSSLSSPQLPYLSSIPPPAPSGTEGFHMYDRVSPNMLVLLIILAAIFFISAVLHLLVRFLLRPLPRDLDQDDDASALQGPLQQLFHLHDAGVDQSFIDAALPVFTYKAIVGVKDPFDCAVCLCEFLPEDKLRLLPKCSHAFHVDCIDTWLLSHSTCPLCRASLLADFPSFHCHSPAALLLEAGGQSSPAIISDYTNNTNNNSIGRLSLHSNDESRAEKSGEIQLKDEGNRKPAEKVVSVKLGKFRSIIDGGSNNSSIVDDNADPRRCFSTGSFEYVMNESSSLRVAINPPTTKQPRKKTLLPLTSSHRQAMSECGCEPYGSWRDLNGFESQRRVDGKSRSIANESFSVSKKRNESGGSRRAFSFRFPINHGSACGEGSNGKSGVRRVVSEIDMVRWNHGGRRSTNLGSEASAPSFARRTLFWFIGRPSKVVHLSSASSDRV